MVICSLLLAASLNLTAAAAEIEVVVDPRVELVSAAVWIASGEDFYGGGVDRGYAAAAREWFAPTVNHKAVRQTVGFTYPDGGDSFAYDAPIGWALHQQLDLSPDAPLPQYYVDRAGGEKALQQYSKALGSFIAKSDFNGWLASQSDWRLQQIVRVQTALDKQGVDWVGSLEGFFGEEQDRYVIVVAPFVGQHAFGPSVTRADGTREVYQVMNPASAPGDAIDGYVRNLALHEFGHSFSNPVVDAHWPAFQESEALLAPIERQMNDQAYGTWQITVYEHVLRACEIQLHRAMFGEDGAEALLQRYLSRGFRYLPPLVDALDAYVADREQWPTFADYGDELAAVFAGIAAQGAEAWWSSQTWALNLNDAMSLPGREQRIVLPTGEGGEAAADYARSVGEQFATATVADAEVMLDDLPSGTVLRLYGTPTSNAVLGALIDRLPIAVAEDHVVVDGRRFDGEGLRLIAVLPHPNGGGPVVVYTGTSDAAVVGINGVFHGPTGWVVAGPDDEPLGTGFVR